jgi:hypothetical protein
MRVPAWAFALPPPSWGIESEIGGDSTARQQYALEEVSAETENLTRLAVRVGSVDAYQRVLDELVGEAAELRKARLARDAE